MDFNTNNPGRRATRVLSGKLWKLGAYVILSGLPVLGAAFPTISVVSIVNALNNASDLNSTNLVQFWGSQYSLGSQGLNVTLPAGSLHQAGLGFRPSMSFSGAGGYAFDVSNTTGTDSTFNVFLYDTSNRCIVAPVTVKAGESKSVVLPFQVFNANSYNLSYLPPLYTGLEIEPTYVNPQMNLSSMRECDTVGNGTAAQFTMKNVRLLSAIDPNQLLAGTIDQYGQTTVKSFATQVTSDSDLTSRAAAEASDLSQPPILTGRDQFGGDTSQPMQSATGHWHIGTINGKMWLIDPIGYPVFLSAMMLDGAINNVTPVTGHESWFQSLPSGSSPLAQFYTNINSRYLGNVQGYEFYNQNLYKKYGSNFASIVPNVYLKRVARWGFNSIAGNIPSYVGKSNNYPYVVYGAISGNFVTYSTNSGSSPIPDPFDPNFSAAISPSLHSYLDWLGNDPYCVGMSVDNELGWLGNPNLPNPNFQLSASVLNTNVSNSPAKRAMIAYLQRRYLRPQKMNICWGTTLHSWSDLNAPFTMPATLTPMAQRDLKFFQQMFADKYFSQVSSTFKSLAPNMLYFGQKFDYWTPEVLTTAAKYADVLSFNCYRQQLRAQDISDLNSTGKPVFMTEFSFGNSAHGLYGSLNDTFVAGDAAQSNAYLNYVKQVSTMPNFVGMAWYNMVDDPASGTAGGDNTSVGFVDITDTPYANMVSTAQQINPQLDSWHARGY